MKRWSPLLVGALAATLAACSSTTMINSNVPGAKVYLDGELVGTAPYAMSDMKIVGSTTQVRLEAPGYAPVTGVIRRNEEFSVGACIGGIFLLVPFLWIMEYKPVHTFELRKKPGGAPAGGWDGDGGWSGAGKRPRRGPAQPAGTPVSSPPSGASPTGRPGEGDAAARAEALNEEGKQRMKVVDFAGAAQSFRAAIAARPDPRYYYNLCFTLHKMGSQAEARAACEVAAGTSDQRLRKRALELIERIDRAGGKGATRAAPRPRAG
jgi:hypothetical protein